jgi:hypothetical protein
MSDNVLIALIIAVAIVVVCGIAIFVLKDKFRSGKVEIRKDGIQGSVDAHEQTVISGNTLKGKGNKVNAYTAGQIKNNVIDGEEQQING